MLDIKLNNTEKEAFITTSSVIVNKMCTITKDLITKSNNEITTAYGNNHAATRQLIEGIDVLLPLLRPLIIENGIKNPNQDMHYINKCLRDAVIYNDVYKMDACVMSLNNLLYEMSHE